MGDVLVVGEALVDIVLRRDRGREEHPGGSPANVALGLARLRRPTRLLTRIGDDARGIAVRTHLEGSGVVLEPGSIVAGPTSTATAVIDETGAARYDFALDWDLPSVVETGNAEAVHTGSIATFLPPGGDAVVSFLERVAGQVTITYDPNARPALMGEPAAALTRVERLVAVSDVVKVSDEDLAWLLPGQDPAEVARDWLHRGPALVVVTLGGQGSLAVTPTTQVGIAAPPVTVVDTVGAGDSFMSGLIDYLAGADLLGVARRAALRSAGPGTIRGMLDHAATIAAITCSRAGANPPTLAELPGAAR